MSKFFSLFLPFVLCLSLFAGCRQTDGSSPSGGDDPKALPPQEDQVVVAIGDEPVSGFDPTVGWGHGASPLIQSSLLRYNSEMAFVGDLALDYTLSEDGLTWTFRLREDARFTDGTPVLASDAAFTFQTAKNSQSALDLSNLADCEAVDPHQLRITLHQPSSTFLHTAATLGIVPAHAYGEDYADHPIGSGPWRFVQWNKGEQLILEANQDYYGEIPKIQRLTLVFMDEDAAFAAAQAGQVDVALTSAIHGSQEIPGMRLEALPTLDNRGFTLPVTAPHEVNGRTVGNAVTCHLSIRHAIAYAIDRERLATDAVNGYAAPAYSENDGLPWNNPAVRIETDPAYAKALLAEDGWADTDGDGVLEKDGLKAAFSCIYPSGDGVRQAVAMAAAAQLAEIGIHVEVEGVSWDEIARRMFSDPVLMGWGSANPYTSYLLYHSSNAYQDDYYNPEGFSEDTVDAYLTAALHAATPEEANAQWQLAQWDGSTGTAMQGICPWVWLVNIQHLYYVAEGLDIGRQALHPHGADWSLLQNVEDWSWT